MCFVWTSERTAIISLYSINWLKGDNKIVGFSQIQQYFIIYFDLLATNSVCKTIITPSLQVILQIGYM